MYLYNIIDKTIKKEIKSKKFCYQTICQPNIENEASITFLN